MKRILLSMMAITLLCGCSHREIKPYNEKEVTFDWKNLVAGDTKSAFMDLHYYNLDTGSHLVASGDHSGVKMLAPYGSYGVIAVSSEVENVEYKGFDTLQTASLYAKEALDGTLLQPRSVYSGNQSLTVQANDKTAQQLLLFPYVKTLEMSISLSGEVISVASCKIILSGIAHGVNLFTGELIHNPEDNYSISSYQMIELPLKTVFSFFGIDGKSNIATIDVTLSNGNVTTVEADITDVMADFKGNSMKITLDVVIEQDSNFGAKATLVGWKVGTGSGIVNGQ